MPDFDEIRNLRENVIDLIGGQNPSRPREHSHTSIFRVLCQRRQYAPPSGSDASVSIECIRTLAMTKVSISAMDLVGAGEKRDRMPRICRLPASASRDPPIKFIKAATKDHRRPLAWKIVCQEPPLRRVPNFDWNPARSIVQRLRHLASRCGGPQLL